MDNVKHRLQVLMCLVCSVSFSHAQKLYYEPVIGTASTVYYGNNLIADSIRVITSGSDREGIRELRIIGINVGSSITPRLELLSNLSFSIINPSYQVYNEQSTCTFCPVKKSGGQRFTSIQFGVVPRFTLLSVANLKLIAFIGSSAHFNLRQSSGYTPISDFNGKWPMVAKVLNAIDAAPGKTFLSFSYGAALYYKKISLTVKYAENISNSITRDLEIDGVSYPFNNDFNRLSVIVGYQFYFRKKGNNN